MLRLYAYVNFFINPANSYLSLPLITALPEGHHFEQSRGIYAPQRSLDKIEMTHPEDAFESNKLEFAEKGALSQRYWFT